MTLTRIEPFLPTNLEQTGSGLNRPECVLAVRDGALYTCDWTLGIARIAPDGTTSRAVEADLIAQGFRPNGIALTADGSFLFANLSKKAGGVWQVGRRGEVRPFATEVAGRPIPPTNFVLVDGDRVWITISASGKHEHFTAKENTGRILLVQDGKVTVAADGLNWTNELRISPDGRHLFVNETFACRTTRYDVGSDGTLTRPLRLTYPDGTFPDGMAFDAEGALWIVCVVSNRLLRVAPDLTWSVVFEDIAPGALQAIASAYAAGCLTWEQIAQSRGARVSNLTSVAFGGPDLKTLYLGGLGIGAVQVLRSPVAGMPMGHWR